MQGMPQSSVISITDARRRPGSVARVVEARQRLRPGRRKARGRLWLNGVPLGRVEPAVAHLFESYD
jgi:hypothetical protein